jgi:hypothetical protein
MLDPDAETPDDAGGGPPHDAAVGPEENPSKKSTFALKLKAVALGFILIGIGMLAVFFAWAAIFQTVSYLVGWP